MSEPKFSVLMAHNDYQTGSPSGENASFRDESELLSSRGHRVAPYTRCSDEIRTYSPWQRLVLVKNVGWSSDTCVALLRLLRETRPDVAHFQNIFPLISPSAYRACQEMGIPVVQALRNFRLLCPEATFYRDGGICEECLGRTVAWPSVVHGCYHDSRPQSAVLAAAFAAHNWRKTWHTDVNMYIAPTQFVRQKFIEGGFPAEKIAVKPNFVRVDPGERAGRGDYALYVGRLSPEKGITTLLAAWKKLPKVPLRIVGDGPLAAEVERSLVGNSHHVSWLGQRSREETLDLIKGAMVLVFPSEWYETFGRVAIEAFACGVPVIASRIGAVEEVVSHERTGLQFAPGSADELAAAMEWAWTHPREIAFMGRAAREEYKTKYTPETNYERLMGIYNGIIRKIGSETTNPGAHVPPERISSPMTRMTRAEGV